MTNRAAIYLLVFLILTGVIDYAFDFGIAVFAGQKLLLLIDTLAIWR